MGDVACIKEGRTDFVDVKRLLLRTLNHIERDLLGELGWGDLRGRVIDRLGLLVPQLVHAVLARAADRLIGQGEQTEDHEHSGSRNQRRPSTPPLCIASKGSKQSGLLSHLLKIKKSSG